jgi:hypothetical protein
MLDTDKHIWIRHVIVTKSLPKFALLHGDDDIAFKVL